MKRNHDDEGNEIVRLELKYCERCGGLWVRECGAGVVYCDHCQRNVAELPAATMRKAGRRARLRLPVQRSSAMDEIPGDGMEFEAAGGAA